MSATAVPEEGFAEQGLSDFLLTVDDLETMVRAGVFARDGDRRVELVEGKLVRMSPESLPHARYSARLSLALNEALKRLALDQRFEVLSNTTLRVSENTAFEPDGAVIARDADGFFASAEQVALIIETSVSSLKRDLGPKSRAYAAAGVPEYWVIDVKNTKLHIFRMPVDGAWSQTRTLGVADLVSPLFAPRADIALTSVF